MAPRRLEGFGTTSLEGPTYKLWPRAGRTTPSARWIGFCRMDVGELADPSLPTDRNDYRALHKPGRRASGAIARQQMFQ